MSIPYNEEHWEAGQQEVDRKKVELMANMSDEAVARIRTMETAVSMLENAKVPFVLFASPYVPSEGIMQYNRETYHPNRFGTEGNYEGAQFMNRAAQSACKFFANAHRVTIQIRDISGELLFEEKSDIKP